MIYLDTSALIKRFVNEKGSALVQSIVQRSSTIATAKIAYAEIFAGLTRKLREGHLSRSEYDLTCRQFESDWQAYLRVELQDQTLLLARDLIQAWPSDLASPLRSSSTPNDKKKLRTVLGRYLSLLLRYSF